MREVGFVGDLFLLALKMLIVPLVAASLVTGVAALGQYRGLGRTMRVACVYFVGTMLLAVLLGLLLVTLVRPGTGVPTTGAAVPETLRSAGTRGIFDIVKDLLRSFLAPNALGAMAADPPAILAVITFSLAFGAAAATLGDAARPVVAFFASADAILTRMIRAVMWTAPVGVFALIAARLAEAGGGAAAWRTLHAIGLYVLVVLAGLTIHAFGTLPALLRWLGRRRPGPFAREMVPAFLTAFSTASSTATLPVTMDCVIRRNGVSERAVKFVAPLGATLNMNGTALYEAVAVVFIAQAYGVPLGPGQLVVVAVTATLAAIGAAAIPEAGLVTMLMVLGAVGLPAEGIALLLPVDWLLDRCRTTVNVWDDGVGAAVVERLAGLGDGPTGSEPG
jgi:Na+/H+-dicarboxylate symporter